MVELAKKFVEQSLRGIEAARTRRQKAELRSIGKGFQRTALGSVLLLGGAAGLAASQGNLPLAGELGMGAVSSGIVAYGSGAAMKALAKEVTNRRSNVRLYAVPLSKEIMAKLPGKTRAKIFRFFKKESLYSPKVKKAFGFSFEKSPKYV